MKILEKTTWPSASNLKNMTFSNVVIVGFKHTTGLARHVLFVRGTCNSAPSHAHTLTGDACQKSTEIGS